MRVEAGSPPLAAPIGQIIASQALVNVLGASRYATIVDELPRPRPRPLRPHARADRPGAGAGGRAARGGARTTSRSTSRRCATSAQGLAASEEELLLLALFGDEAEPLLRSIRDRAGGEETADAGALARDRDEQIRSVVRIVQETGVGEITVEEDGVRGQRAPEPSPSRSTSSEPGAPAEAAPRRPTATASSRSRARWSARSTAPPGQARAPFVEEGDPVSPGQVLCILEAMKLMNEVKAEIEAIVRRIHVGDAEPVEYGQLLFELEPLNGRPVGI